MRILLIVNSTASSVTPRNRVVIQKALAADHELSVAETNRRGHAARLAHGAARDDADVVVVFAGDGTLNEAASGVLNSTTALAPLPGGSTNVYARTLGYDRDPLEAVGQLLEAIDRSSFRHVGIGRVNGRLFLFNCGVGFDAAVVERAEQGGGFKRYLAHPLYAGAALDTWFRGFDHRHERFVITLPDGTEVHDSFFAILSKSTPYSFLEGRPLVVAPNAGLDRPLSLTAIRAQRATPFLGIVVDAAFGGRHLNRHRGVTIRDDLTGCTISGDRPFPYQVDGEFLGETTNLEFAYEPDALRLLVP